MAIYSFRVSIIKRSEGRSVMAAAAYRAAEELTDDRTGQTFDYSRKSGVVYAEILTPVNAPDWASNREALWNAVEASETRVNAQTAREFTLALPHEITDNERRDLVEGFLLEECVSKGMVADYALHLPDKDGDHRNHHVHVLLTMREIDKLGFTRKERDWNARSQLDHWRASWADHVNKALERADRPERVDHRTLKDQGLDQEPTLHEGPEITAMTRDGHPADAAIANENKQRRNADRDQLKERHKDLTLQIEQPELVRALAVDAALNPTLPQAIKGLADADGKHVRLNQIRRKIAQEHKLIYGDQMRRENIVKLEEAIQGGLESVYRNPKQAKAIFGYLQRQKFGNPAKAARLMKSKPKQFGRMKGWAIGNLFHSRARKEALAVLPRLAEKMRIAEYSKRKMAKNNVDIKQAKNRLQRLRELKWQIEKEPNPQRLMAQRQIHKAARGLSDEAWNAISWPEKKIIAEARRAMKSDQVRRFADRELTLRQRQLEDHEYQKERQKEQDRGHER